MQYKAFISYSHRDEAWARRLHRRLEGYRPPRGVTLPDGSRPKRLYPIYRDRDEMAASPSLPGVIETALAASERLIVLCSPASAKSAWVDQEIRLFAAMKGADRILPVIVGGQPPDCFPPALQQSLAEPLAPDFRDGKDGFDDGSLKVIAGLLGVSLGLLKNREEARRKRRARLGAGLAAAASALIVFAGFSYWRAAEQEARAEAEARMGEARALASVARAVFEENPGETSVAAMIAAQSASLGATPEARALLRDVLALAPLEATDAPFPWNWPQVAASGDGRAAVFLSALSSDAAPARSAVVRLAPDLTERGRIAFDGLAAPTLSADGAWLAVGGRTRRLLVHNLNTGATALNQPVDSGLDLAFSPAEGALYAATQLGDVLRWTPGEGRARRIGSTTSSGARLRLPQLSLASSGDWLLRAEDGRAADVLQLGGGGNARSVPFTRRYATINWRDHSPAGAIAHPDGRRLLAYDSFNAGAVYEAETMGAVWSFDDQSRAWSPRRANVFSNDGAMYARGRVDGDVSVREMTDGRVIHRSDHGGAVRAVAFLDQPPRVIAAGDGGASIWRLGDTTPASRCADGSDILSVAVDSAGAILLGARDGRLIRCDGQTGATLAERTFGAPIASIAAAADEIAIALKLSEREDTWSEFAFADRETGENRRFSVNEAFDQVRLSADGARVAARSWTAGEIAVWDWATGNLINRFAAKGDLIGLTPDGALALIDYMALAAYDVQTGRRIRQFGEAAGAASLMAAPYDDLLILSGDVDGERAHWAWSAKSGKRLWRAPGGVDMAAGGGAYAEHLEEGQRWRVVDRATGAEIGSVPFQGDVWSALLSPDGGSFAATRRLTDAGGVTSFETTLWNAATGRLIWRRTAGSAAAPPPRVVELGGGRAAFLFSQRDADGAIRSGADIFDWSTGNVVFSVLWSGFSSPTLAVDLSARRVAISTGDGTALHSLIDGARLWHTPESYDRALAFAPNAAVLIGGRAVGGSDVVSALNADDGGTLWEASLAQRIQGLAVTSDGRRAIAAFADDSGGGVRAWRLADGAPVREIVMDAAPRRLHPLADATRLVVRDNGGVARVFNLTTGAEVRRFPMSVRADQGAFSADGAWAATASGARLRAWNVHTGAEIDDMIAPGRVTALAISPDGREIAYIAKQAGTGGGAPGAPMAWIWRPGTGAPVDGVAVSDPRRLAYGPTGRTLAIRAGDGRLSIIDAAQRALRFTIAPLTNGASTASAGAPPLFTADGAYFLVRETGSYGQGNTSERRVGLRIFDSQSGAEIARLDAGLFGRSLAATRSGYFYATIAGRLRHLDMGAATLDRQLDHLPADEVIAVPGSDLILTSGYGRRASLIDSRTGARRDLTPADQDIRTLDSAVDRTGRFIALSLFFEGREAGPAYELRVYDVRTGDLLASAPRSAPGFRHIAFAEGGETVIAAQYPENALIANAADEGGLFRWRWRSGAMTPLITDNPVADFAISPDSAWLVTSEGGKSRETVARYGRLHTRVVRISDGAVRETRPHDFNSPNLALSDGAKRIAVLSAASPATGAIREVGAGDDALLTITLDDVAFYGKPLGFLNNSETFVLGERSGARIYTLSSGAVRRLRTPWRARRYALSRDGALLAIGGDKDVAIWALDRFEKIADMPVSDLYALTFAGADNRSLIAATSRGVRRIEWDLNTLVATACAVYKNDGWEAGRRRVASTEAPDLCKGGD